MKDLVLMGALGVGYLALQRLLTKHPVFTGRVSERTELIAWNARLMDCIQRLAQAASEDEIENIMDRLEQIHSITQSPTRTSEWGLQRLVTSVTDDIAKISSRTNKSATVDEIRIQTSLFEDVVPLIEEILNNVLHNHILDSLGP